MRLTHQEKKPREKLKKGLWSPDEDEKLRSYIHKHGVGCWNTVSINAGLLRNGKSCRLRWINYLRPGLKREAFSLEEEVKIMTLHNKIGNRWSQMARFLPGRTDNEIKNHWHTNLKKCRRNKDGSITQTDADHRKCISIHEKNQPSSFKTIPHTGRYASFGGKNDVSLTDIDQVRTELQKQDAISNLPFNLPKVFFAEWLTIDQTNAEIEQHSGNNLHGLYKFNSQNSSMQSLLLDEEVLYASILDGIHNSSNYGMFYPTHIGEPYS